LADGATLLRGFAEPEAPALMAAVLHVLATAPFRHMITPGGHRMSVSMTNCGRAGWVTDRGGGPCRPVDPPTSPPPRPVPQAVGRRSPRHFDGSPSARRPQVDSTASSPTRA